MKPIFGRNHRTAPCFGVFVSAAFILSGSNVASGQCFPEEVAKLTAMDAAAGDEFGSSISIDGDTAIVGSRLDDDDGADSGAAYVYRKISGVWQQIAKLTALDAAAGDNFGISVSLHGNRAVIGAYHNDDDGSDSGCAYVFLDDGILWKQIAKLTASDAAAGDSFGISVSISGTTAVVGAYFDDHASSNNGSAYVFREVAGIWHQIAKLTASDAGATDLFGFSVSLSGTTVIVGAYWNDEWGSNSGAAYVFRENAGPWHQIAKLAGSDPAANDQFGWAVSLSADTAVVGAPLDDDDGSDSGSAYVYREVDGAWLQMAKLTAADAASIDQFGWSVGMSGSAAVVGSHFDDDSGFDSGSAYAFAEFDGVWQQMEKLTASDAAAGDEFGVAVSISGDNAVIGAPRDDDDGSASGSAYVFDLDCDGDGDGIPKYSDPCPDNSPTLAVDCEGRPRRDCNEDCLLDGLDIQCMVDEMLCDPVELGELHASDGSTSDVFGTRVAISGDTAIISAVGDDALAENSGAVYIFRKVSGFWQQIAKLTASDGAANENFGIHVSISGNTAVVGAQFDDDGGIDSGSAYVFREVGGEWMQIAKLTASDAAANDRFGFCVSISGNTAVIGAAMDDDNGSASGSAYIFREVGGIWQQIAKLTASDGAGADIFGNSVSISGNTALIGAEENDDAGNGSGSAYVFREVGGVWQQLAKLTASDAAAGDQFGNSVAISGYTALIGAYADNAPAVDSGSSYVFRESGGVWQQIAKLTPSGAVEEDRFGWSLSLSGTTAVIGRLPSTTSDAIIIFREYGILWTEECVLLPIDGKTETFFGSTVSISGDAVIAGAPFSDELGGSSGSAYLYDPFCDDDDGDSVANASDVCPDTISCLRVNCDGRPLRDCNGDCLVTPADIPCLVTEMLNK